MNKKNFEIIRLKWDENFFGISCAKIIMDGTVTDNEWADLKSNLSLYQFITILNLNSNPYNSKVIGEDTSAYLSDINIQFFKEVKKASEKSDDITIYNQFARNNQVLSLASFEFSRFISDDRLKRRGGESMYKEWLLNSFNKADKHFAIYEDANDGILGFVLYSFLNDITTIELIAVTEEKSNSGIGTKLFRAVEYETYKYGLRGIKVGTQIRNQNAINFYHKVGCTQVSCNQIYHLWND